LSDTTVIGFTFIYFGYCEFTNMQSTKGNVVENIRLRSFGQIITQQFTNTYSL